MALRKTIHTLLESQKEKKRRKGQKNLFKKIMAKNFSNLGRDLNI